MKLSTDRILTTHVGSLPRPKPLIDLILAKERGEPVDPAAFEAQSAKAVEEVVAKRVAYGTFITRPSPGILTRFVINLHNPDEAAYL
jgi:5-methyltetrahydropteroyltriglutamate--homocysteine methyltransferase